MPQPNALRLVVWITLSSSLLGALFAYAENRPHADFVNTELHGVLAGGLNGGILSSLEILVLRGAYGASLRQLPFLPYLALRSLLYLGIILLVLIAKAVAGDLVPKLDERPHLRELGHEAHACVDEKGDPPHDLGETRLVDLARLTHAIEHGDRRRQRVAQLLNRRRARLLQMVGADVHR